MRNQNPVTTSRQGLGCRIPIADSSDHTMEQQHGRPIAPGAAHLQVSEHPSSFQGVNGIHHVYAKALKAVRLAYQWAKITSAGPSFLDLRRFGGTTGSIQVCSPMVHLAILSVCGYMNRSYGPVPLPAARVAIPTHPPSPCPAVESASVTRLRRTSARSACARTGTRRRPGSLGAGPVGFSLKAAVVPYGRGFFLRVETGISFPGFKPLERQIIRRPKP